MGFWRGGVEGRGGGWAFFLGAWLEDTLMEDAWMEDAWMNGKCECVCGWEWVQAGTYSTYSTYPFMKTLVINVHHQVSVYITQPYPSHSPLHIPSHPLNITSTYPSAMISGAPRNAALFPRAIVVSNVWNPPTASPSSSSSPSPL